MLQIVQYDRYEQRIARKESQEPVECGPIEVRADEHNRLGPREAAGAGSEDGLALEVGGAHLSGHAGKVRKRHRWRPFGSVGIGIVKKRRSDMSMELRESARVA